MAKGRGRLSSIQLLPQECVPVVIWAAEELQKNARTQVDIYKDFEEKLIGVMAATDIPFEIPSLRSFNRYSLDLALSAQDISEVRAMATAVLGSIDPEQDDDVTKFVTASIKAAAAGIVRSQRGKLRPKDLLDLSRTLKEAALAQTTSAVHRQRIEAEMRQKTEKVLERLKPEPGLSKESIARLRRDLFGVRPDKQKGDD
ncbi:MAG: phage protein Gp27 family protein [Allorhizobium sp.]